MRPRSVLFSHSLLRGDPAVPRGCSAGMDISAGRRYASALVRRGRLCSRGAIAGGTGVRHSTGGSPVEGLILLKEQVLYIARQPLSHVVRALHVTHLEHEHVQFRPPLDDLKNDCFCFVRVLLYGLF